MSLGEWLRNSWLVEHKTSPQEIAGLLAIVERDLANAKVAGLSDDWRFNIAYNAALQAATAALAASGFRAAREQHHYRTIQSLAPTIGWQSGNLDQLDRFRKKTEHHRLRIGRGNFRWRSASDAENGSSAPR